VKRIAVLGEIGTGNLGDDLGYQLLRDELIAAFRELDEIVEPCPLSGTNPLDRDTWSAVVTGCGTLLDLVGWNYVQRLNEMYCPTAILGTGIQDERAAPPTPMGRLLKQILCIRNLLNSKCLTASSGFVKTFERST
jgi:hypothetical protein